MDSSGVSGPQQRDPGVSAGAGWSLVDRLTISYTASTFVLIAMVVVALYWSLARTLNVDDNLFISDKAQTIVHLLRSDPQLRSIKDRVEKEWVSRKFERCYVKISERDGRTIAETPNFPDIAKDLFDGAPTFDYGHARRSAARRETPSGKIFKVVIVRVPPEGPAARETVIQVALDRTSEETFLATFRSRFMIVLAAALIMMTLINRRIAVRGIQPVSQIANAAKSIRSTTLHERINVSNVPAELTVLVSTFNEMLDRLNESFERLSRFSQDIAHDLRTPINNLQGELEVALSRRRSPEDYEDVLGSCLEECARLTHLINNLLFLARAENPTSHLSIERLDLKAEVLRITEFFEASATEADIRLQVAIPEGVAVQADRALFQRAIGNLISNALNYTEAGGLVLVSGESGGRFTEIKVTDTGVGIARQHLGRVFDRFYRVDESRSAKSGGSGLGLSIVKGIMTLHRGNVAIESEPGRGTTLTLTFPQA